MIELKNIVEDIVLDMIDGTDEVKEGKINKNQKREIAAYVLNRVKPMYITSNKGFTNSIVQYQKDPQLLADIMLHISQAVKIVKKTYSTDNLLEDLDKEKMYFIFPKIYGKVISSRTMMPVESADVTLKIDSRPAKNIFGLWKNPTEILPIDDGIFSFAPLPETANPPYEKRTFTLELIVQVDGKKHNKIFHYETEPELLYNLENDFHENILQLEDIYIAL
jgi:competence protein ComFB